MRITRSFVFGVGIAGLLAATLALPGCARQGGSVPVDPDDIGGVVTSTRGPEAGVWVIAETTDLPTRFAKIVVTDDQGRYLLPDLPKAAYDVWVRGYGLVDSQTVKADPGRALDLTAVVASSPRAAADYYPANYWYSLLEVPDESEFPGTGDEGNGILPSMKSQAQWISQTSSAGCVTCHQMGGKATREFPESLGQFPSSREAWARRLQSGQAGGYMISYITTRFGRGRALQMFADWTDRITKGELPPVPPRPQGLERNVVITAWDYADARKYVHDGTASYKSNPTVNANGPYISAPEESSDNLWVLDPTTHTTSTVTIPVRDPDLRSAAATPNLAPSPYWDDEVLWDGRSRAHSTMWDSRGRLWSTSFVQAENPDWCREGSSHPSAKVFPIERSGRSVSVYDPTTKEVTLIATCFGTHHLMFGDAQVAGGKYGDWLFFNSGGHQMVGWIDTGMYDRTGDEQRSQGWTPLILDTNGNGRRDAWVEPDAPAARGSVSEERLQDEAVAPGAIDATKDRRLGVGFYSIVQSPLDGSIWGSVLSFPGSIVRIDLGSNPPETALSEIYDAPWGYPGLSGEGHTTRGIDVDRHGVVWTNLSGSGHLASFDRRKCTAPLNGPKATGKHCPEGWTVYPVPGPNFKGVRTFGSADGLYLVWVDQFNTFGLGENVPFVTGSNSDSLMGLVDGKWVTLRMPYPLGMYTKGMDGRIDDPEGGWKGRGLWTTHGTRAPWHLEGGKGRQPQVIKFQLRPDPLAK